MNLEDTVKSGVFFVQKIKKEVEDDHEKDVSSSRCVGSYHRCGGCSMQEPQEIYKGKNKLLGGIKEWNYLRTEPCWEFSVLQCPWLSALSLHPPLVNAGLSKKVTIVRFNKQVNEGEEITRNMLDEVEVGNHNLPENVIRNVADVEGKYLTATVYVRCFADNHGAGRTRASIWESYCFHSNCPDGRVPVLPVPVKWWQIHDVYRAQ